MRAMLYILIALILMLAAAFAVPKVIHTTGAGNAGTYTGLPADKGCFGHVFASQSGDGGTITYACIGIPYQKHKTPERAHRGFIGQATMDADGTITLDLYRAQSSAEGQIIYRLGDPSYDAIRAKVPELTNGKTVQVPPFE